MKSRSPAKDGERRRAAPGEEVRCELCEREVGHYTVHHLVPRAAGGKFGSTAKLCPTCHRQLHALFSVNVLAKEMSSIKAIRANPEMAAYLRWARKQKEGANFRVRRAKNRR